MRYGETSLVVTAFTELFGIQTYMINGVRTTKKAGLKAAMYQSGAILDATVYHNEQKNMQRIKEANWGILYKQIFRSVIKNNIALYMAELILKSLKQPEENIPLFQFCEDAFLALDEANNTISANLPLYFTLHLAGFFGFGINRLPISMQEGAGFFLDLEAGIFSTDLPNHTNYLSHENAAIVSELLNTMQPIELDEFKLNHLKRRELLKAFTEYFALHVQDFGTMKTLPVLQEVL